jgi:hypothetical protein
MVFQSTIVGEYKFECSSVEGGESSSNDESGSDDGNGNEDVLEEVRQHTDKRARICDQNLESVATSLPFDDDDDYYSNNYGLDGSSNAEEEEGESSIGSNSTDSICSRNVDLVHIEDELPSRRCTHIEKEKSHQQNLFLFLPEIHMDRIRVQSMRIVATNGRTCERCLLTNNARLWRCNECTMLKNSSQMLCDDCTVRIHINNPHCMEVLCEGENIFRKPYGHETITFQLQVKVCTVCGCDDPLVDISDGGFYERNSVDVFVASQNGIFHCSCPVDGSARCKSCDSGLSGGAVAFDCIPCEPSKKKGATWFTNSLMSLI